MMRKARRLQAGNVGLESLATAMREDLIDRWAAHYGCPPPPGVRRELLLHAAAWQMQAQQLGGLSAETRRSLKRAVERIKAAQASAVLDLGEGSGSCASSSKMEATQAIIDIQKTKRRTLVIGARLQRDWNGRSYVVDVVEGGYLFEGTRHRSLSVIARSITGARWSGPRFFGL